MSLSLTAQDILKEEPILLFSPNNPVPIQTIFLSNIDQAVTFPVETVFFYEVPTNRDSSSTIDIAEKVRKAVSEVLLKPYYFMAGRLKFNDESKRLELVCNNAGVSFVEAKSRFSLKDLGKLSQPNPTFHHLVHRPGLYKSLAETAIFTIQVTRFKCGGFSTGFTTNHAILDGKSASAMFYNLASICRGEPLPPHFTINNDRTAIKARTPPQINYPHNEYVKKPTNLIPSSFTSHSQSRTTPSPLIFSSPQTYTRKIFTFTPKSLKSLKRNLNCSTFDAIVAQIWKARTKAVFNDLEKESRVLFAVDVRNKIMPNLAANFAGNAVITAFATAKAQDLIEKPLEFGVEMVKQGKERVDEEYTRSVVDWLEVYKGIPASCGGDGGFYVSAWWKLGFEGVDFGYGKASHGGPIVSGNDEFVLLLVGDDGVGINVWMGLEKDKMEKFESCVYEM